MERPPDDEEMTMSRLAESYCEDDEAERENEFARETAKAYAAAKDDFHGFHVAGRIGEPKIASV